MACRDKEGKVPERAARSPAASNFDRGKCAMRRPSWWPQLKPSMSTESESMTVYSAESDFHLVLNQSTM